MYVEIIIKTFPNEWKCFCGNKPKYRVLLRDFPDHLEPPASYCCCENCITRPLKDFEDIFMVHEEFEKEYSKIVSQIHSRIRKENETFL